MSKDPFDSQEWADYAARVRDELIPMITNSAVAVTLVTDAKVDVKLAVELGFMILLDKPIIAVVGRGSKVPSKLALVADEILEGGPGDPDFAERFQAAMQRITNPERGSDV